MKSLLFCIGVILLWKEISPGTEAEKHILLIQSYHPDLIWTVQCEQGIQMVLGEKYKIHPFYMDTKRLPETMFQARADMAWEMFQEQKPDLVMIGDDNGLRLLGLRFADQPVPVVYFGINNNPRFYFKGGLPSNITGVLERLPVFPWLRYLKQIMPGAETALVLMDSSPTSFAIFDTAFPGMSQVKAMGMTITCRIAEDWDTWKGVVNRKNYEMLIIPTFHAVKQGDATYVDYRTVVQWTSANADVPVFSHQDYTVGEKGATGAYVIFGQSHGALAGEIVRKILEEKQSPRQIHPKTDIEGKFYFNRANLDRFNLSLPPDIAARALFQ